MSTVWDDLAGEFTHLYSTGRRLLAVAGEDAERSKIAGDALAAALTAGGTEITHEHTDDAVEASLRETVSAFTGDGVLLVSGPAALLSPELRGMWNFAIWQLAGDEQPHTAASALIDMSDPENPTHRFADFCALPSTYKA